MLPKGIASMRLQRSSIPQMCINRRASISLSPSRWEVAAARVAVAAAVVVVTVAAVVATVAADIVKKHRLCQALLPIKFPLSIGSAKPEWSLGNMDKYALICPIYLSATTFVMIQPFSDLIRVRCPFKWGPELGTLL